MQRTHYMPVNNILLNCTRMELLQMVCDCRANAVYNQANGFDAAAITNNTESDYYLYLAERSI